MRIYDITRTLQEAPLYPGDSAPQLMRQPGAPGAPDRFLLTAEAHTGTHADAFSHFLPEGESIESMPLDRYCGPCRVLTVPGGCLIRMDDLRGRISGAERIAPCHSFCTFVRSLLPNGYGCSGFSCGSGPAPCRVTYDRVM